MSHNIYFLSILGFILNALLIFAIVRPIFIWINKKRRAFILMRNTKRYDKKMEQDLYLEKVKKGEIVTYKNDSRLSITPIDAIMNIFRSVFICGGAGSGKTYTFIKPMISKLIVNNPCIVYDYKNPELIKFFIEEKEKTQSNMPLYVIDFKNPENSSKINPISPKYIATESHAREYANVLYKNLKGNTGSNTSDPFWDDSAISFLTGCIWYLKAEDPLNCNIPNLVKLILQPIPEVINTIRKNQSSAMICSYLISALDSNEMKLLTNVGATLQMSMSILVNNTINTIFSEDETPLTINNPNTPTQLLIGADEELSSTYSPLISLIMAVAIKQMNKADMLKSYILIDEAPTLYIPKLEELPAVARSRKISLIYCSQDISQIDNIYGKEKREVLLSNLGNQFYGRTTNQITVKYIIDFFGQESKEIFSSSSGSSFSDSKHSSSSGESFSSSSTSQMRNIYESSNITSLQAGEFIWQLSDNKSGRPLSGKSRIEINTYIV